MGERVKTDPPVDSGGGGGGGNGNPPSYPKSNVISSFAELQALIPDYESRTLTQLLASPLFTGKNAYQIAPGFWRQLQSVMLAIEKGYGVPPSEIPAGVLGSKNLGGLDVSGDSGGTGGGGGGGTGGGGQTFQPVFPDYAGAISALFKQYDSQVAAGRMPFEDALAAFNADVDKLQLQLDSQKAAQYESVAEGTFAQNRDTQLIDIAKAQQDALTKATLGANQERTARASDFQRMLLSSLPAGSTFNVPGVGAVPGTTVDPNKFYDIAGLNSMIPKEPINWPTPTALPDVPSVTPFDPKSLVTPAPPPAPVAAPDISSLLAGLLNPQPSGYY